MKFRRLRAEGFRNLAKLDLDFDPEVNWIHGDNGQGKTNLLEALLFPVSGRSHRGARDEELLRFGAEFFFLGASLEDDDGVGMEMNASYEREGRKRFRRDGGDVARLSELMVLVGSVVFGPEDAELVGGPPETRRRFLDYTLSKTDPGYLRSLIAYKRVMRQRNALLRAGLRGEEWEVWTRKLAEYGAEILARRRESLPVLNASSARFHAEIGGEDELLELTYRSTIPESEGVSTVDAILMKLEDVKVAESLQKRTLAGPHRDDMIVDISGENARKYASQGQKRSAAIALKLAQADYLARIRRDRPVVFLDDVFSELDPGRRQRLCHLVGRQYQTFLATPRPDGVPVELFPSLRKFRVEAGLISPE